MRTDMTETIFILEHIGHPDNLHFSLPSFFPSIHLFFLPSLLHPSCLLSSSLSLFPSLFFSIAVLQPLNWSQDSLLSLTEDWNLYFENYWFRSTIHWPWGEKTLAFIFLQHILCLCIMRNPLLLKHEISIPLGWTERQGQKEQQVFREYCGGILGFRKWW